MKFLLTAVNAKYIHSNPGIYSMQAYAKKYKEHIAIAEYTINHRQEDILADIYSQQPDVIGFSCYIWNWNMIQDLVVELHKILPDTEIWLGGPEVSFDSGKILNTYPMLTGIMIGEGEATFLELMAYYVEQKGSLTEIPGLSLQSGQTKCRELTDLSTLPFLYDDLSPFENRIIYYESSRGCPFRCSYCLSSIDKKVRLRDLEIVKKELAFFLDKKVSQVKFVDRTFNCNHEHAYGIWKFIHEQDNGITNFHFEISADLINERELTLLASMRPGLVQLEIGVQSTNEQTISEIHRTMDLEILKQVVEQIRRGNNIHVHLDLIAGLPYEDYDTFVNSFDEVFAMKPEQLQLGFLKVLKGSYMHEMAGEYGISYLDKPPYEVLYTKWLPFKDVLRLKKVEEMVELYYNSNQFTHIMKALIQKFSSPFHLFEALGEYFEQKGYFVASPSRSYRYQILLEFAVTHNPERELFYRELLTYDMYLRENLKSRPDFAKSLENYKDVTWNFYQEEEASRKYLPDYKEFHARQLSKMTHLEPFSYEIFEDSMSGELLEEPVYVLFDYQNRNPLTHEARTILLRLN